MLRQLFKLLASLLLLLVLLSCSTHGKAEEKNPLPFVDEDWGDGLKVLTTFKPAKCEHKAKASDIVHYHYVGRLGMDGRTFGKSFDYNSPYIVALGQGRIIAGMDRGLLGMCLWERRRITIPPHLGYGERGVGSTIPPNSTLVFYVRLIKLERSGFSLGEDQSIEGLWKSGLASYTKQEWQPTVDLLEEALKLYHLYENVTLECLKNCSIEVPPQLNETQKAVLTAAVNDDSLTSQFLVYAARSKCLVQCKNRQLPYKLRTPDGEVLAAFRRHEPYSYLHYSYFKLGNIEEGAKCLFTYCFSHTETMCSEGLVYYRRHLGLRDDEVVYRIPGKLPHHKAFLVAKTAYENKEWHKSVDSFESALVLYHEALERCQLVCEDSVHINMSQGVSVQKKAKFDQHGLSVDSMEYYTLLTTIIRELLGCRIGCVKKLATVEGVHIDNYLENHFHYLQFNYYKLGMLEKAAETAATYLVLDPSSVVMNQNVHLYTSKLNVPAESFVPRKEYVSMSSRWEAVKQLLHFAEARVQKKKVGLMGDPSVHIITRQEL